MNNALKVGDRVKSIGGIVGVIVGVDEENGNFEIQTGTTTMVLDRNAVYPLAELYTAAEKLASQIAANAPIAVRAAKKAINEGLDLPMDEAVVVEEKAFGSCFETADQQEGMGAFLEKRKHEPFTNK